LRNTNFKLNKMKYVYEFTNKRKLTKREFIHWFEKKFLYTIRKFDMISKDDRIGYYRDNSFRGVVLKDLLEMFAENAPVKLVSNGKCNIMAIADTSDIIAESITNILINGKASKLKELAPIYEKIIRPLYLFLDKEVELYAKLKGLKYKKQKEKTNKISEFVAELEKKHPEIKNSVISSYLELFR